MKLLMQNVYAQSTINNNPPVHLISPETIVGILASIPELKKYRIRLTENKNGTLSLRVGNLTFDLLP